MKATIYIPEDQAHVYESAKEKLGESISKTFLGCLERELQNRAMKTERIVFEKWGPIKKGVVARRDTAQDMDWFRPRKFAFQGRFIVGTESDGEDFRYNELSHEDTEKCPHSFSVAVTKGNRLAVLFFGLSSTHVEDFKVFENFEEFKNASRGDGLTRYPESLIQAVASELEIEHIENLDI